jgi:hypothetical protein
MMKTVRTAAHVLLLIALVASAFPQEKEKKKKPAVPGPMLADGYIELQPPEFTLKLVRSSQTVAALLP